MTNKGHILKTGTAIKTAFLILLTITAALAAAGCANRSFPPLPDNAPAICYGESIYSDEDMEDGYITIEYNGRVYAPYGTVARSVRSKDVYECVGYLYREDYEDDRSIRLYTLIRDPDRNYIMDKSDGFVIMEQPIFWRALDTRGKDIYTPDFIQSLDYALWENE